MKRALIIILILLFYASHGFSQCYVDRHNSNWFDAWVSCEISENPNEDRGLSHWIMYDFNHVYGLGNIHLWNINDRNNLNWGAKTIAIDYSNDGNNWTELGEFDIEMSIGSSIYEGIDIGNFDDQEVRFVVITILDNWGGDCYGFAEIKFQISNPVTVAEIIDEKIIVANAYPNPFSDNFKISIETTVRETIYYSLTDIYGRNVFTKKFSPNGLLNEIVIDANGLIEGVYLLQISQGDYTTSKRLIKSN